MSARILSFPRVPRAEASPELTAGTASLSARVIPFVPRRPALAPEIYPGFNRDLAKLPPDRWKATFIAIAWGLERLKGGAS